MTRFNDSARTGCNTRKRQSARENPSHASPDTAGDGLVTRLGAFSLKSLIRARAKGVYQKRVTTRHRVTLPLSSQTLGRARHRKVRHPIAPGTADRHGTHGAIAAAHAAHRLESRSPRSTIGWTSRGIRAQPCETIASATRNRHTRPDRRRTARVSPQIRPRGARPCAYCWAPRTPCRDPGLVQSARRSARSPRPRTAPAIATREAP